MEQVSIPNILLCCWPQPQHGVGAAGTTRDSWLRVWNALAPPGDYKRGWHNLWWHRLAVQSQIPPGWACFRFALCQPPKSPRFLGVHKRGITQAPAFPLRTDPLYFLLMGLHSEMRSGRRNHCVRRYCQLTKHLDFCRPETILFTSFWVSPLSKFRRCSWRQFRSGTTHRLTAWMDGETLAATSQVLEKSEEDSKNTKVENRKHSQGRECLGLVRKGKKKKKTSADQSLISHNPPQKCPGPSNIYFFPLPHHPCYCLPWWFACKCIRQLQIFHC